MNNGTVGGTESGGVSGGGSTGADSATVQAAVAKDAKDWTLDEQEAVAKDIAKNGSSSIAYAKAKAAMDAGTKFSMKLTDGQTLTYRIIGINHDNLADGSGKAGLTFLTTSTGIESRMDDVYTVADVWEKSELRQKMNSGEIWNLMPADFKSKVKPVAKLTNNSDAESKTAAVTATSDRLFLLSYSEIVETPVSWWSDYPWIGSEGTQYEAFKGKVTNPGSTYPDSRNSCLRIGGDWWQRSLEPGRGYNLIVDRYGDPSSHCLYPTSLNFVCPAWCF